MAKLSKKEFAEQLCGLQTKALSVYISRGKVIVDQDGLIDTENAVNILFVQERQQKKTENVPEEPVTVETVVQAMKETAAVGVKPKVRTNTIKEKKQRPTGKDHLHEDVKRKLGLESKLKEVEIDKKKREADLMQNKLDRAAGKLIPTVLVKGLFSVHFKSIAVGFKQGIDQLIIEFGKKRTMNVNEKAELKKEMIKILNGCISDTIDITKKDIENIVLEYSQASAAE